VNLGEIISLLTIGAMLLIAQRTQINFLFRQQYEALAKRQDVFEDDLKSLREDTSGQYVEVTERLTRVETACAFRHNSTTSRGI
jgi:hypothetical protein